MIPYENLTFANDFLFCKILESRPELCKELVELILDRKIKELKNIRSQFSVKEAVGGKGVRFDVIFEDSENTIYVVEMQTTNTGNLPKRVRYYQAMLDTSALEKGMDYEDLPQSFVIFICTFDVFHKGRHLYTFEHRCVEDGTIVLDDQTKKVFLCAEGTARDVSNTVLDFLNYVAGRGKKGRLADELQKEVEKAVQNEKWRAEYMQNNAVIMDARREGRAEGRAEGQSLLAAVIQRLKQGETPESIRKSGVDEDTIALALSCR